jgi:two-component system sensor histidine kinase UhpB
VRWIRDRGFPIRDQSGEIYRIAGIATDITDRKRAEDALRESEERFRQLTENINEVFWITSADFSQEVYVSPGFQDLTGYPPDTLYPGEGHKAFFELVHPDDLPLFREIAKNPDQEFDIEYRVFHADGSIRWVRDRGFPIRNQSGQIYRMGGVADDITDRKEAEDRLKTSTEQLRALSASLQSAREQEAARIAHQIHDDMGGILTALRWELEALQKMIHEPSDPWHLKVVMHSKLVAMIGLTDTTINVVRRIASELRPSILDDLGLVEALEWQTQQFQARTGIQCCCDFSLQNILPDDQQSTAVFRIVQEALTNVLRHSQATRVGVAIREEEGELVLAVADNGRGITEGEKASRESLGILGMQERAHLIGGRVDIVGVRGAGTTLRVRVPLAKVECAGAI